MMKRMQLPEKLEIGNPEHVYLRDRLFEQATITAIAKEIEVLCPDCGKAMEPSYYRIGEHIQFICNDICSCCERECDAVETMSWDELKDLYMEHGYESLQFFFGERPFKDTHTLNLFDK